MNSETIDQNLALDVYMSEVSRLRDENEKLRDALFWCSGSQDFAPEGKARKGWEKLCAPLLPGYVAPNEEPS